jgi:hypothetical protein
MAEDRLQRVGADIEATCADIRAMLAHIKWQLTHVFWLMMALLTGTMILFVKVFFFWE